MSDELSELENLHEPSADQPERLSNPKTPILMAAGIAVIVIGTGLLVWLGPTFNPRKPPPPAPINVRARLKSMLQDLDGKDAGACRAKLPELIAALKMDDDEIRLGACLALGRAGSDAVLELVPLLNDPDANVRYYAVWALGQVGPSAREAVPDVLQCMKDSDSDVRRKAIFALGRIKPEARTGIPALAAAFGDNDVEVRTAAVDALVGYGKAAAPALIRVLREQPGLEPRRLAVLTLTQIGPDSRGALPQLRPLFLNSNSGLADESAAALAVLGKPAIPTLAEALQTAPTDPVAQVTRGLGSPWAMFADWHDYPEQHRRALRSLGKIGPDALDQIVTALHSPNSDIREQAAGVLGTIGFRDRRVIIPLVDAMRDPEANVRHQAGWALKELAPDARGMVPGLTRALHDERKEVRSNAVDFLEQLGAAAIGPLVEALADPDEKLRLQAVTALQELRANDVALYRAVTPLLKDNRASMRQSAVAVLHRCGPMALPELLGALRDQDATVRRQVIQALQTFPPDEKSILPALTAALQDDDAPVRAGAASGLGRYGPKAIPALGEALKDKDAAVRLNAVLAVSQLGTQPRVFPLLPPNLKDDDPKVRQTAVVAIGRFGVPAIPFLIEAMRDPDTDVWRRAMEFLKDMEAPDKAIMPPLFKAIKSDDSNIRQGAAYAMARFGADAVGPLVEAMKDPDPSVQWAAVDTLDTIGPAAKKAVPALAREAATNPTPKVRHGALVALVTIHGFGDYRKEPVKAVPGLIELLSDPEVGTRWGAAQTLAAIGPPAKDAIPALTKLLQDKNLSVSESARYALQRIQRK